MLITWFMESHSWFLCGFPDRLMAIVGSMRAGVLLDVMNLLSEFLFSSGAAFCELFHQVIALAAGATAAATVGLHALSFLDTSAAGANDDENWNFTLHAAGATAAATVGLHAVSFLTKSAAGAFADVFLVLVVPAAAAWAAALSLCTLCSSWTNLQLERQSGSSLSLLCKRQLHGQPPLSLRVWCPSLYPAVLALVSGFSCGCLHRFLGLWKEQRNIQFYCEKDESSNLQAFIQEAVVAEYGQLDIVKGKGLARH